MTAHPVTLADFSATTLSGQDADLAAHRGEVVLVVNTASRCGFTPQYAGLQDLHARFHDRGFSVLGFPCDQFKHQEPGSATEIAEFCQVNYGVEFPMFAKITVNGPEAHPLYRWLTGPHEPVPGSGSRRIEAEEIPWNFTKFLIGRDGTVVARYGPSTEPAAISSDIEAALRADG